MQNTRIFDISIYTKGDTELLSLHAVQACNASNQKKQTILWFITYRTSAQRSLYLR